MHRFAKAGKSSAKQKPGEVPAHRIPIYDHEDNVRGHVGNTATGATVARFLGRHGAELKKHNGRLAWVGDKPPPPPMPVMAKPEPKPQPNIVIKAESAKPKLAAKPKAAKGSVS